MCAFYSTIVLAGGSFRIAFKLCIALLVALCFGELCIVFWGLCYAFQLCIALGCTGLHWCALVCIGLHRCALYVLVCIGLHWFALECIGVHCMYFECIPVVHCIGARDEGGIGNDLQLSAAHLRIVLQVKIFFHLRILSPDPNIPQIFHLKILSVFTQP